MQPMGNTPFVTIACGVACGRWLLCGRSQAAGLKRPRGWKLGYVMLCCYVKIDLLTLMKHDAAARSLAVLSCAM